MRNRQEIINYLGLEMSSEYLSKESIARNEEYIKAAERIEKDFEKELSKGTHGYGLHCDFVNLPHMLEDYDVYPVLVEVANYDGVVIYERRTENE